MYTVNDTNCLLIAFITILCNRPLTWISTYPWINDRSVMLRVIQTLWRNFIFRIAPKWSKLKNLRPNWPTVKFPLRNAMLIIFKTAQPIPVSCLCRVSLNKVIKVGFGFGFGSPNANGVIWYSSDEKRLHRDIRYLSSYYSSTLHLHSILWPKSFSLSLLYLSSILFRWTDSRGTSIQRLQTWTNIAWNHPQWADYA